MDISCDKIFDGVWACSSLLHETAENLPTVFKKIARATKDNGTIYVSFKYGEFAGERNGRYFTDLNEEGLNELIKGVDVNIIDTWITGDVRLGRGEEKWLNAVLKKI